MLIGTVEQIIEDLQARRERWGISYYNVHEPYMDAIPQLLRALPANSQRAGSVASAVSPQPADAQTESPPKTGSQMNPHTSMSIRLDEVSVIGLTT